MRRLQSSASSYYTVSGSSLDSPLEGSGFELPVPCQIGNRFEAFSETGSIGRQRGGLIRAVVGLVKAVEMSDGRSTAATRRRTRRRYQGGLSARIAHRGTETSNPSPSSGESDANLIFDANLVARPLGAPSSTCTSARLLGVIVMHQ